MKLFGLNRKKGKAPQDKEEVPVENRDQRITPEIYPVERMKRIFQRFFLLMSDRRRPLFLLILILAGFFAIGSLNKEEPLTPIVQPVSLRPEDIMRTAYEGKETTLTWNLSPALTGPSFIERLKREPMNLWAEFNERGVLLYHEFLDPGISQNEKKRLMGFIPKLKAVYRVEGLPQETMFLAGLSYDEKKGTIHSDLKFLESRSQAVNYLRGRPLDYVEIDTRTLQDITQPIISGRITGIMVGATSSVLLESGEKARIGDRIREGVIEGIYPGYLMVRKGDTHIKLYVGQQL